MKAFEKHWEGVTGFELLVDPSGRVANCTITRSSGHEELDSTSCSLARFRARFAPARGSDGQPMYGVYRSQAVWVIPEDSLPNTNPGPDLQVRVDKLPQGTVNPAAVKLAYIVDSKGRITTCQSLPSGPSQPSALVEIACHELSSGRSLQLVRTPGGSPVTVVRTAAVEFKLADAPPPVH